MSIEEIINELERLRFILECKRDRERAETGVFRASNSRLVAINAAISLLRTHPDAQPNGPLTIEDLLNMSGRPVWIEDSALGKEWAIVGCPSHMKKIVRLSFSDGNSLWADQIFGSGKIYRRPPKEDC